MNNRCEQDFAITIVLGMLLQIWVTLILPCVFVLDYNHNYPALLWFKPMLLKATTISPWILSVSITHQLTIDFFAESMIPTRPGKYTIIINRHR